MKDQIRVAITGAGGQIGYQLAFRIAAGEMFGKDQPVGLHLLELPRGLDALKGLKMELADCAFPLLDRVLITDDPENAFSSADYVILVGACPRKDGMERSDLLKANAKIFAAQGKILNDHALRDVKVLVVGNPANTNALICSSNAPSIPVENFSALTRLDHNRATAMLAEKFDCSVNDVDGVIIWGNHSSTQFPDVSDVHVRGLPIEEAMERLGMDPNWIDDVFIPAVQNRGGAVIRARGASSAGSAANAIIDHMRDWTSENGTLWTSMAVMSDGCYGVKPGVFYSFPVSCYGGHYTIIKDLALSDILRTAGMLTTDIELREEREAVKDLL